MARDAASVQYIAQQALTMNPMHVILLPAEHWKTVTPLLNRCFLSAVDEVFFGLKQDVPPYCWSMHSTSSIGRLMNIRETEPLFRAVGVKDMPTVDLVLQWLRRLRTDNDAGRPVTAAKVRDCVYLLEVLSELLAGGRAGDAASAAPLQCAVVMPDHMDVLRDLRHEDVFLADAPWAMHRIDHTKYSRVHANVPTAVAIQLGARRLSSSLLETVQDVVPADASSVPPEAQALLRLWERNIRSSQFQGALRRALSAQTMTSMMTMEASPSHLKDREPVREDVIMTRLSAFATARLVPVKKMRAKYALQMKSASSASPSSTLVDVTLRSANTSESSSDALSSSSSSSAHVLLSYLQEERDDRGSATYSDRNCELTIYFQIPSQAPEGIPSRSHHKNWSRKW